jgi:AraC-like DNA-binding protein
MGQHPLDAVAYRLGFQSAATFVRAFRRWTGTTPGAFRRALGAARPGG